MPKLPALDPATVAERIGWAYPEQVAPPMPGRRKRPLGDALGLTHFGVNLTRLEPGSWSALRHWHSGEDEFVFVLEGELVLITDAGEQVLAAGTAAGFPAGAADGHHLINRSDRPAVYLEVGDRSVDDQVRYPDVDLFIDRGDMRARHKSGEPY